MKKQKQFAVAMVAMLLLSVLILTVPVVMSGLGDEEVTNITNVNETNETVIGETLIEEAMADSDAEGEINISQISLGEAVDYLGIWITWGDAFWFGQTSTYYYDGDAAQSGDILDNEETWMETTVSGPDTLTFYWKANSEYGCDFLTFEIDGVEQDSISGDTLWAQKTYTIGSGSHTLAWKYTKDGSVSSGEDCGWVDKVELGPPPTPATGVDLFFLVDGSGSIDDSEFQLQREGLAYAISDPTVIPQDGSVSVCVIQFASYARLEVPPTTITSQSIADTISANIMAMSQLGGSTNMADAFDVAVANFPSDPAKKVIDISTDGYPDDETATNNARDAALAAGFDEVWAIGVGLSPGSSGELFLQQLVHSGDYMYATDFQDFQDEIKEKIGVIIKPCEPCVSIEVDVSINKDSYTYGDTFNYTVSVTNNQAGKSRIAITYGLIDPTPKTITIGTRMPDIYQNDTYSFSADFIVPTDVYSGDYVFFAAAFDMETGCCGCDAEPYSVEPWWWIATTSKEESSEPWLEIVED